MASKRGGRKLGPVLIVPFFLALLTGIAGVRLIFSGEIVAAFVAFLLAGMIFGGGSLIRGSMRAAREGSYQMGRTPGVLLIALATGIGAHFLARHGILPSVILAIGAAVGGTLAYGSEFFGSTAVKRSAGASVALDPLLHEAHDRLDRLKRARYRLQGQAMLGHQIDQVIAWTDKILERIKEDPRDLSRARKFLAVYLDGAASVTERLANLQQQDRMAAISFSPKVSKLISEMEAVAKKQHEKLLANDTLDLDVQIEVIQKRMKEEGVA